MEISALGCGNDGDDARICVSVEKNLALMLLMIVFKRSAGLIGK